MLYLITIDTVSGGLYFYLLDRFSEELMPNSREVNEVRYIDQIDDDRYLKITTSTVYVFCKDKRIYHGKFEDPEAIWTQEGVIEYLKNNLDKVFFTGCACVYSAGEFKIYDMFPIHFEVKQKMQEQNNLPAGDTINLKEINEFVKMMDKKPKFPAEIELRDIEKHKEQALDERKRNCQELWEYLAHIKSLCQMCVADKSQSFTFDLPIPGLRFVYNGDRQSWYCSWLGRSVDTDGIRSYKEALHLKKKIEELTKQVWIDWLKRAIADVVACEVVSIK